jgi:hypothetical protein
MRQIHAFVDRETLENRERRAVEARAQRPGDLLRDFAVEHVSADDDLFVRVPEGE